jgi:hypothetical protein
MGLNVGGMGLNMAEHEPGDQRMGVTVASGAGSVSETAEERDE